MAPADRGHEESCALLLACKNTQWQRTNSQHVSSQTCHGLDLQKRGVIWKAMHAGLLDLKQAQEWVVTTKLGASDKRPGTQARPSSQGT